MAIYATDRAQVAETRASDTSRMAGPLLVNIGKIPCINCKPSVMGKSVKTVGRMTKKSQVVCVSETVKCSMI